MSYPNKMVVGRPRAFVVRLSRQYLERISATHQVPGEDKKSTLFQQPYVLSNLVDVYLQADPLYLTVNKSTGGPTPTPPANANDVSDLPLWIWNITPIKSGTAKAIIRVIDVSQITTNGGTARPALADPRFSISIKSRWAYNALWTLGKAVWGGLAALAIWFSTVYVLPQNWKPVFAAVRQTDWQSAWDSLLTVLKAIWEALRCFKWVV